MRRESLRWLDWAMGAFHEQVTQRIAYEKGGQRFTGALPGTVLRSGRDTETVEVPGGRSAQV